jgi:hypothetical protein
MIMRRLCLAAALLAISGLSFAQITIHDTDISPNGSTWSLGVVSNGTFDCGSSGANQTWTFADQTWYYRGTNTVVDPSTTPAATSFPTATRCIFTWVPGDTIVDSWSYHRVTPTAIYYLGHAIVGSSSTILDQESLESPLPVTYQTQWTGVERSHFGVPPYQVTYVDSSISVVDGWGTVNTPYGNSPCLRVFTHVWNTISTPGLPPQQTQNVGYMWVNQQGVEVVGVTSGEGVTDPNFTSGSMSMLGVPLATDAVRGPVARDFAVGQNYPNPFNPTTTLPVSLEKNARVTVDIYDETGRLLSHEDMEMPAGAHSVPVRASGWSSGNYFARVSAADQQQTVKMQLVK